jgi:hypothetical protein
MIVRAGCTLLDALGIVARGQQLAGGCMVSGKLDFLRAYGYVSLPLIFGYEPLGMSLCRLGGRLLMQRRNMKKLPDPSNNRLS